MRTSRLGRLLDIAGVLLATAAVLAVLYDWDPTRITYKRFKAQDRYTYDEIRPEHHAVDPASFITVTDLPQRDALRRDLARLIWDEDNAPGALRPTEIHRDILVNRSDASDCDQLQTLGDRPPETLLRLHCQLGLYEDWPSLAGIDELVSAIGPHYRSSIAYFRPKEPNGTLVVFQNGYASTYHHHVRHLERLVNAGFTVAAANHVGYGDNACPPGSPQAPWCSVGWGASTVQLPMRVHFSPLIAAINYGIAEDSILDIAMIGFSAGAWLTMVTAAVEPRIRVSYPVAGFMPRYLQEELENPPNQRYPAYIAIGSLLDQFVLGADTPTRRQIQFFNRYDRCCYRNTRGKLYETAVADAVRTIGGGHFEVRIDESHARHKIGRWTMDAILADLATHGGQQ